MPTGIFAEPARRFITPLVTRLLRKHTEEVQEKKHPERKRYLTTVINRKIAEKKKQFEKKFPTRKQIKSERQAFKLKKKTEKERYESDPIYRRGTIPRQEVSDTTIAFATWNPLLPGARRGLRREAKHGSNYITKQTASGVLKKMTDLREDLFNITKYFTPKGRKKMKKRNQENAWANSILTGDI